MKLFFLFVVLIVCVIQEVYSDDKVIVNLQTIGGIVTTGNEFPWQVSIYGDRMFFCSGSLISSTWVLTAGHCTYSITTFVLGFGSANLYTPEEVLISTNSIIHPNYNPSTLINDISLIGLPIPLEFRLTIQKIDLPSLTQVPKTFLGLRARVSGWGFTSDDSSVTNELSYVDVRIISNEDCSKVYGNEFIIASTICALGWNEKNHGTCSGDSGGPLILWESGKWIQIGVISFVSNVSCTIGEPTGYIRTTSSLEWINSFIQRETMITTIFPSIFSED